MEWQYIIQYAFKYILVVNNTYLMLIGSIV